MKFIKSVNKMSPNGKKKKFYNLRKFDKHILDNKSEKKKFISQIMLGLDIDFKEKKLENLSFYEKKYYEAAYYWMRNKTKKALNILENNPLDEANLLKNYISKQKINILSQLPWGIGGPQTILEGVILNNKFNIQNIGFGEINKYNSYQNSPYKTLSDIEDNKFIPDIYICNMLEWHYPLIDIRKAKFVTFAQTADIDYHFSSINHYYKSFDRVIVSDSSELELAAKFINRENLIEAPPCFGIRENEIDGDEYERIYDTFMSGTLIDSFHSDKCEILLKLFSNKNLKLKIINGHLGWDSYQDYLKKSKTIICYYRNKGGFLTRAIDSLRGGAIPLCPEGNVTSLYYQGLTQYSFKNDLSNLNEKLDAAIKAHSGNQISKELKNYAKSGEYKKSSDIYLRYLVIQASQVNKKGKKIFDDIDHRKRTIFSFWDVPEGEKEFFFRKNIEFFESKNFSPNLLAREYICFIAGEFYKLFLQEDINWFFDLYKMNHLPSMKDSLYREKFMRLDNKSKSKNVYLIDKALSIWKKCINEEPYNLQYRFNYIRAAIFLGSKEQKNQGKNMLIETIYIDESKFLVNKKVDIFPIDFFQNTFDYRSYNHAEIEDDLKSKKNIILSFIYWVAGKVFSDLKYYEKAIKFHKFSTYNIDFALENFKNNNFTEQVFMILTYESKKGFLFQKALFYLLYYKDKFKNYFNSQEIDNYINTYKSILNNLECFNEIDLDGYENIFSELRIEKNNFEDYGFIIIEDCIRKRISEKELINLRKLSSDINLISPYKINRASDINYNIFYSSKIVSNIYLSINHALLNSNSKNLIIIYDYKLINKNLDKIVENLSELKEGEIIKIITEEYKIIGIICSRYELINQNIFSIFSLDTQKKILNKFLNLEKIDERIKNSELKIKFLKILS